MSVNVVKFGDQTVMDISDATVTPGTLMEGYTAYSATGEKITGTMARTNYNQTDATKADYLDGKEDLDSKISTAQSTADSAKTKANAALPKSGGTMTGAVTTKGIILTAGVDYGESLPSTVTPGKLFFKKVVS